MKAILVFIFAIGISASTLFSNNPGEAIPPYIPATFFCPECPILIPKVPLEAPFTEITEFNIPLNLDPVIPLEAAFDDNVEVADVVMLVKLTPSVPEAADFTEEF